MLMLVESGDLTLLCPDMKNFERGTMEGNKQTVGRKEGKPFVDFMSNVCLFVC